MNIQDGVARPLGAGEQELLDTVQAAADQVLVADAARLEVRWVRFGEAQSFPKFELRPQRQGALPIALALGGDWIDTWLYLDDEIADFELWAQTAEERMVRAAEWIEAVILGRVAVELRGRPVRSLIGRRRMIWKVVATFETPRGRDVTSRSPTDPSEWPGVFAASPADEASGRVGPRLFAPYL